MECEDRSVSLLLTDDETIRKLNLEWRHVDAPTDVLSFSQLEGERFPTDFIGDVVISLDAAKRQADKIGHTLEAEIDALLVHGVLHLLGYDHVRGGAQSAKMKKKERSILAELARMEEDS